VLKKIGKVNLGRKKGNLGRKFGDVILCPYFGTYYLSKRYYG